MKHNKPAAVIFDFDDTLVNARPIIDRSLAATLAKFNISSDIIKEKNIDVNRSLRDYFHQVFADKIHEARDAYYKHYVEFAKELSPLENSEAVLKLLHANKVFTAVVSNKNGPRLRHEIGEKFFWQHYFNEIVGAGDVEEDKPSAMPAKFALKNSNIYDYSDVWFIGDSLVDIETAKNLGCKAILFGDNLAKQDNSVYLAVKNHNQLLEILKGIYA